MKLKRRKVKRGRVEIIPMIDTIVILLIFYMTFSRFVEAGRESQIKLPDAKAGDAFTQQENEVIINMFSGDRISIGKKEYDLKDLPGILRTIRANDPAKKEKMAVILRADKSMPYKDLSDFMKICAKAGIIDVTFATLESQ